MISDEQVLEALREVVEGKENFVYSPPDCVLDQCRYVHEDEHGRKCPGCLVGVVFHRLGASLEKMAEFEGNSPEYIALIAGLRISGTAADALAEAQRLQDDAHTWGEALKAAEREFGV